MSTFAVELPTEIFSALKRSPPEFLKQMRLAAAIHWYAAGKVSQEKAALIAGLDRVNFLAALAAEQVEVFAVDMDSLKRELEHG